MTARIVDCIVEVGGAEAGVDVSSGAVELWVLILDRETVVASENVSLSFGREGVRGDSGKEGR